jgi:carbonic anhydrase/acetyltransferase-like protein (isoleucine patch superfamily)
VSTTRLRWSTTESATGTRLDNVLPVEPFILGEPKIDPTAFVAPTATILGDVTIGPRAVVLFGAVVRAEPDRIVVGEETNLQDQVVVHCDEGVPCHIGHRVTVGHAAVVHGALVGDHCLVGIGARLLNNATLGEGAWLAAGSVLTEGSSIPPWTLAVGTPARPLRELRPEEIERQRHGIEWYVALGVTYKGIYDSPSTG